MFTAWLPTNQLSWRSASPWTCTGWRMLDCLSRSSVAQNGLRPYQWTASSRNAGQSHLLLCTGKNLVNPNSPQNGRGLECRCCKCRNICCHYVIAVESLLPWCILNVFVVTNKLGVVAVVCCVCVRVSKVYRVRRCVGMWVCVCVCVCVRVRIV